MTDPYAGQRAFLVHAIHNATANPDDSGGYLPRLASRIAAGEAPHVDTWLALDAIKLSQEAAFDPVEWTGWTDRGEAWLAAGCPPIEQKSPR